MKRYSIEGKLGVSEVIVGGSATTLGELLDENIAAIVTDENVLSHHKSVFPKAEIIAISPGEGSKSLDTASSLYRKFIELEADRSNTVLAIGGGVVCDLAGFCASTFMRGMRLAFVPTTLLAQVDAAIGGKNGVNLDGYKNLIGTFAQPEFVLCDSSFLGTLPEEELRSGLAECIKAGAIGDSELFELIERDSDAIIKLDAKPLGEMVDRAVAVKVNVVNSDEREKGQRRILNFGHTFGHAIERTCSLPHGQAISIGMVIAAKLSVARKMLSSDDAARIENTLCKCGLPTKAKCDMAKAVHALGKDKKREGDNINFVLLEGIGRAVTQTISLNELAEVTDDMR